MDVWLRLTILLVVASQAGTVKISEQTRQYIDFCIDMYNKDPTNSFTDGIINPPYHFPVLGNNKSWFIPKIILWCPITRHSLSLNCPNHPDATLKQSFWQSKQQSWRQPRMIYDSCGNVLLVSRAYMCTSIHHCRFMSSDARIMVQLTTDVRPPFMLFHKSGCTMALLDLLCSQIAVGGSFTENALAIRTTGYSEFCVRLHAMQSVTPEFLKNQTEETAFKNRERIIEGTDLQAMFSSPSSDLLEFMFLKYFEDNKADMEQHMSSIPFTRIYTDHTDMYSKNIGLKGSNDNWSKQHYNLFFIFNELGQVISWVYTRSSQFEEVKLLFTELQETLVEVQSSLQQAVVDHCCEWRDKLIEIFGATLEVKLNLHKAVERVVKTVSQDEEDISSQNLQKEFAYVFRSSGDLAEKRSQPTAPPNFIHYHLQNFLARWTGCSLLTAEARSRIDSLRPHIAQDCLSGIQAMEGIQEYKDFYEILKTSVLSQARTMGPELAFAILTVIIYNYNKSRVSSLSGDKSSQNSSTEQISSNSGSNKSTDSGQSQHGDQTSLVPSQSHDPTSLEHVGSSMSMMDHISASLNPSDVVVSAEQVLRTVKTRKFGFIGRPLDSASANGMQNNMNIHNIHMNSMQLDMYEYYSLLNRNTMSLDHLMGDSIKNILITETFELHEILKSISEKCCSKNFNAYGVPYLQMNNLFCLLGGQYCKPTGELTNNKHEERLNKVLKSFNLSRYYIDGDGDCAFNSVLYQLQELTSDLKDREMEQNGLLSHLHALGLVGTPDEQMIRLRELFVQDLLNEQNDYRMKYCAGMSVPVYVQECQKFLHRHSFGGELGDLVIKALSSILKCPIVVFTSIENVPVVPFIPEQCVSRQPMYLAYTHVGPGHYDGTMSSETSDLSGKHITQNPVTNFCRCGTGKHKGALAQEVCCSNFCDSKDKKLDKRKYTSRCPCLRSNLPCISCSCVNCGNSNNSEELLCESHRLVRCLICKIPTKVSLKNPDEPKRKRNRVSYKHKKSYEYLNEQGEAIEESGWSTMETCLLETTLSAFCRTSIPVSPNNVSQLYNFVVTSPVVFSMGLKLKTKSHDEIEKKLQVRSTKRKITVDMYANHIPVAS